MSTDQCPNTRPLLGLHALGRLDGTRAVAAQAHVDGCPSCTVELAELRQVAGILGQADPQRVAAPPPSAPESLRRAIFTEIAQERTPHGGRSRQGRVRADRPVRTGSGRPRRKTLLLAAAALVMCLGAGAVVVREVAQPDPRAVAFTAHPQGVQASATVEGRGWGTMVHLDIAGLPQGNRYMVWLEKPDGGRMPAGSFIAGGDRTMSLQLAVGMPMSDAMALGISTPADRNPLLRAPLRS